MSPTPSHTSLRRLAIPFLTLATLTLTAQTPTTKLPTFDVATFRLNTSVNAGTRSSWRSDTFQATNWDLQSILSSAFAVRRNLIFGLPKWAQDAHYEINAKVLDADTAQLRALTPEQRRAMLIHLLESRFSLKWHYDTRPMPDLQLVVAKGGSKLKESPNAKNAGYSIQRGGITGTTMSVPDLTGFLSSTLEKPVVDKTNLTGHYDLKLRWTPDDTPPPADTGQDGNAPPPLFTALQEQLGLKLQPGKDPIQTVVIDSIAPPTAN